MQKLIHPNTRVLKPMQIAAKVSLNPSTFHQNCLKPMRIAAQVAHKPAANEEESLRISAPALRRHVSRAHAASLARTHERIEIEIEIDFPVWGVGQAGLAPLNLRSC